MRQATSRRKPSPAMVVAIIALAFAVTGTSVAGVATISALSKKDKKQIKGIAQGEIGKAAPGLAVASAKTAGSADNAANADKLDGRDASDFTPAGRVHSSGRVVLNDPTPNDGVLALADVLVAGPFSVRVFCGVDVGGGSDEYAQVLVFGPNGSSFSGSTTAGPIQVQNAGSANLLMFQNPGNIVHAGQLTAVAPSGQVVSITGSAETNDPAGDCVFGVTAIGP